MPLLSTTYCTIVELERFMSTTAVTDFADHDADGTADTDVVEDWINHATEQLDFYLRQRHRQTQLAGSTLVNRWCVRMAARYGWQSRGNSIPASVEAEYQEEIKPALIEVRQSREGLPGVQLRDDLRMTWSNVKIDRRYRYSTVRVTKSNSSDAPTRLTQDTVKDTANTLE